MEDATAIILHYGNHPGQSFFGVFDGHNGSRCARYLAQYLPSIIAVDVRFDTHPQIAINDAFLKVDNEFLRISKTQGLKDGSTAIVVIIKGNQIYVANTGDSRAILCDKSSAVPLSTDHKPLDNKERKRINAAGGHVFLGRVQGVLGVARAFGDIDFKREGGEGFVTCEPDIKLWNRTETTEFIVLACDGVWDVMTTEDVTKFVRDKLMQGMPPQEVTELLVYHCFQRGSLDNISAIIVSFLTPEKIARLKTQGKPPRSSKLSKETKAGKSAKSPLIKKKMNQYMDPVQNIHEIPKATEQLVDIQALLDPVLPSLPSPRPQNAPPKLLKVPTKQVLLSMSTPLKSPEVVYFPPTDTEPDKPRTESRTYWSRDMSPPVPKVEPAPDLPLPEPDAGGAPPPDSHESESNDAGSEGGSVGVPEAEDVPTLGNIKKKLTWDD
uniref:protein-serine/threonine phosphatase n=1 Tax=Arcella intermedia TaxID=1963864 RepID=A0A6B2L3N8_9EUKA